MKKEQNKIPRIREMPLSFNIMCDLSDACAPEHLRIMAEAGFKYAYLEWHYWDGEQWDKPTPPDTGFKLMDRFRKRIKPNSLHIPVVFQDWKIDACSCLEKIGRLVDIGGRFGVKLLTLHPFPAEIDLTRDLYVSEAKAIREYEKALCEVIFAACRKAEKAGISLTIENNLYGYLYDIAGLLRIIKKVGAANLGVCLDTGHANVAGLDIPQAVRELGPHLFETHCNDNFGWFKRKSRPETGDLHRPPGIGTINWVKVITAMNEIGFAGPVNFELNRCKFDGDDFRKMAFLTYHNWRMFEKIAQVYPADFV